MNFEDVDFELCLLCLHCLTRVCSHFSFPVNLLEILKGFKSIPPSPIPSFLSHFLTLTLVSWLQQGLKRLQFISTRSVDGGLI